MRGEIANKSEQFRNYRKDILEEKLLRSPECWAVCNSHPQLMVEFARRKLGPECSATSKIAPR